MVCGSLEGFGEGCLGVLDALVAAVPYKIHTVLTDKPVLSDCRRQAVEGGIQFTSAFSALAGDDWRRRRDSNPR
jgi:hypothetical protein